MNIYSPDVVCTYIDICKYLNCNKVLNLSLTIDFALVSLFITELES